MSIKYMRNQIYTDSLQFEHKYSMSFRKKTGLYFTFDHEIIDLLLSKLFNIKSNKALLRQRILEPSVGTGIIIFYIIVKMVERKISSINIIHFIENNIYTCDINKSVLNLYKDNINKTVKYLFNYNKKIHLKVINTDFTKHLLFNKYFNFVISNPPFVSFYGPKGIKKTESMRQYYLKNYDFIPSEVTNGRLNSSMFFIENGLKSLKNNGILAYVLDDSFLEPPFKYIRKYILHNCNIRNLYINFNSFKNVGSGQLILIIQKVNKKHHGNIVKIMNSGKTLYINQDTWMNNEYEFKIIDNKSLNIIKKISNHSLPLKKYFPKKSLRTNTMLLNMKDKFLTLHKGGPLSMPFYEGSKSLSMPYGKLHYTYYFNFDNHLKNKINNVLQIKLAKRGVKNKKRIGFGNLKVYKSPKLYIRQSAKRIIATYSNQLDSSNNSLYSLSNIYDHKSNSKFTKDKLLGTLAQLNSNIDNFFAIKSGIIRFNKGKQPQIRISKLKKIPLVKNKRILMKLAKMASNVIKGVNVKQYLYKINIVLYKYYHMNDNDINIINKYIK